MGVQVSRRTNKCICVCVYAQAKSPIIEVLEERLMKAAEDRGSAAAAAADARDTDELEAAQVECPFHVDCQDDNSCEGSCGNDAFCVTACLLLPQAAIGAAIGALSSGRPMSEAQQAAEAAAVAADAASVRNLPEALDEFGRDMNVEKRRQVHSRTTSSIVSFSGRQCRLD